MSFQLVPKSVTLNDLERCNGRYSALGWRHHICQMIGSSLSPPGERHQLRSSDNFKCTIIQLHQFTSWRSSIRCCLTMPLNALSTHVRRLDLSLSFFFFFRSNCNKNTDGTNCSCIVCYVCFWYQKFWWLGLLWTRLSCILHKSSIDTTIIYKTVVYVTDTTAARWRHTPTKLLPLTSSNPNPKP